MEEELQDMLRRLQQEELVLKEALYASEKPEELHAREKKEAEEAEEKGEKRLTAALAAAMGDDSASSSSSDSEWGAAPITRGRSIFTAVFIIKEHFK